MKIGQLRLDDFGNYLTSKQSDTVRVVTLANIGNNNVSFQDWGLKIRNNESFSYEKKYYVKIQIIRANIDTQSGELERDFTISLGNNINGQSSTQQFLKTFQVPNKDSENTLDSNNTANIELVFAPNINFSYLIIRLDRDARDFSIVNNNQNGRTFEIGNCEIYEIINIKPVNISSFNKIGVQGPPGLLMCINGQEIRIGPSGIYQTRNGYKINFMGFVIKDVNFNYNDYYFILDYQQEGD